MNTREMLQPPAARQATTTSNSFGGGKALKINTVDMNHTDNSNRIFTAMTTQNRGWTMANSTKTSKSIARSTFPASEDGILHTAQQQPRSNIPSLFKNEG